MRLVTKLLDGCEERFEVEDDGAAEGHAAQRLPVDAEVDTGDGEVGDLVAAEVLMGVAGGLEERVVDFKAAGAALDGSSEGGRSSCFEIDMVSEAISVEEDVNGWSYRSIENSILAL